VVSGSESPQLRVCRSVRFVGTYYYCTPLSLSHRPESWAQTRSMHACSLQGACERPPDAMRKLRQAAAGKRANTKVDARIRASMLLFFSSYIYIYSIIKHMVATAVFILLLHAINHWYRLVHIFCNVMGE
jgi:hypothetical protein